MTNEEWQATDVERRRKEQRETAIQVVTMLACLAIALSLIFIALMLSNHYGWGLSPK